MENLDFDPTKFPHIYKIQEKNGNCRIKYRLQKHNKALNKSISITINSSGNLIDINFEILNKYYRDN